MRLVRTLETYRAPSVPERLSHFALAHVVWVQDIPERDQHATSSLRIDILAYVEIYPFKILVRIFHGGGGGIWILTI